MSSKRKRKIPCPLASVRKPPQRPKSYDQNWAGLLDVIDKGSYFEQEILLASLVTSLALSLFNNGKISNNNSWVSSPLFTSVLFRCRVSQPVPFGAH